MKVTKLPACLFAYPGAAGKRSHNIRKNARDRQAGLTQGAARTSFLPNIADLVPKAYPRIILFARLRIFVEIYKSGAHRVRAQPANVVAEYPVFTQHLVYADAGKL